MVRWVVVACALASCGRVGFDAVSGGADGGAGVPDGLVSTAHCPIRTGWTGTRVTTAAQLRAAIAAAAPGDTIVLADGTYTVTSAIDVTTPNLTIAAETGRADRVIVRGNGSPNVFYVQATGVQLISLTVASADAEAIVFEPLGSADITGVSVYDVTVIDSAGVGIRVRPYLNNATGPFSESGTVACSRFLKSQPQTCSADSTFGIRVAGARGWTIRDNYFSGKCSPDRVRALWVDGGSRDTTITDNVFADNKNNLMLGTLALRTYPDPLPAGCSGPPDVWGGLVCNNRIAGLNVPVVTDNDFEEGIALWRTCDTWVMHNSIASGTDTFSDLEYRYAGTYVHLVNNLASYAPLSRDGAAIDPASQNALVASPNDFVDAANVDLHLAPQAPVPAGIAITQCLTDADGKARNAASPTPGAFER